MITLEDYLMGRDQAHPDAYTDDVRLNAEELLSRVNKLLLELGAIKVKVSSGWRPEAINNTVGGAKKSNHITGSAIDIYDPMKMLARSILRNKELLETLDLYMEEPGSTPGWVHLQSVPPKSGKRIFLP